MTLFFFLLLLFLCFGNILASFLMFNLSTRRVLHIVKITVDFLLLKFKFFKAYEACLSSNSIRYIKTLILKIIKTEIHDVLGSLVIMNTVMCLINFLSLILLHTDFVCTFCVNRSP